MAHTRDLDEKEVKFEKKGMKMKVQGLREVAKVISTLSERNRDPL